MTNLTLTAALLAVGVVVVFVVLEMTDPSGLALDGRPGGPGTLVTNSTPPPTGAGSASSWWSLKPLRVLGDPATSGLGKWPGDFDAAPLKTYDFDGDGTQEVVAHSNDTTVHVYSASTGRLLAQLRTTYPPAWHVERVLNGVEAARLAPGEEPSIVVANHAAYVSVWRFDPAKSNAQRFHFDKVWEKRMDTFYANAGMDAKPVLGDLDRDGKVEIVVQTEERGVYALRAADGSMLWKQGIGGGNSEPVIADLDDNGKVEVLFASDSGVLTCIEGATGRTLWTFEAGKQGITPASISVAPVVADLDGQSPKEILFTARDAHAREVARFGENHVAIMAVRPPVAGGVAELLWKVQPAWAHPLSYTHLVVHDVTGDGVPEVLGMDWNTIGHIPGNWEHLGPAHVFALDAQGNELWMRELESWWSNKDIVLGDFDGDGKLEVLANGPRDGYDGLWRLDAATGASEAFLPVWPWKVQRAPVVADIFGRGTMQLVIAVEPLEPERAAQGAILLLDLGKPWSVAWPGYQPAPP